MILSLEIDFESDFGGLKVILSVKNGFEGDFMA